MKAGEVHLIFPISRVGLEVRVFEIQHLFFCELHWLRHLMSTQQNV